jgi:hypothetical protein
MNLDALMPKGSLLPQDMGRFPDMLKGGAKVCSQWLTHPSGKTLVLSFLRHGDTRRPKGSATAAGNAQSAATGCTSG